jgi:uncharacterized protein (TIGR00369 family)
MSHRMSTPVRIIDIVLPSETNHHGTLFGGVALSLLDKVAFIAAVRHGRRQFVTASCDRVDFSAPAREGEIVEAEGQVIRVGRSSVSVETTLHAEDLLTGERRLCTRGVFHMVAPRDGGERPILPPLGAPATDDGVLRMAEQVFPTNTSHHGVLLGGEALNRMGKAAFVAASRRSRKPIVMAASRQIDFVAPIMGGDLTELTAVVKSVGRTSLTVEVELWGEKILSGERERSAVGEFVMVAVSEDGRPVAVD